MGHVVVVVAVLVVLFKTFTQIFKVLIVGKEARYLERHCGIQPRRKFYTRSQDLCLTGLGDVSRLSLGLDLSISRDPTPKKVLYAKSGPMSDKLGDVSRLSSGLDP